MRIIVASIIVVVTVLAAVALTRINILTPPDVGRSQFASTQTRNGSKTTAAG